MPAPSPPTNPPEPLWPAVVGLLAVGGLYLALPEPFSPGPRWLLLALLAALTLPAILAHRYRQLTLHLTLGHLLSATSTAFLLYSLSLLLHKLLTHSAPPRPPSSSAPHSSGSPTSSSSPPGTGASTPAAPTPAPPASATTPAPSSSPK